MHRFCSGDFIFEIIRMNNILLTIYYYMYLTQMIHLTKSIECKKLLDKNSNVYANDIWSYYVLILILNYWEKILI